jgi:hypothetical protein
MAHMPSVFVTFVFLEVVPLMPLKVMLLLMLMYLSEGFRHLRRGRRAFRMPTARRILHKVLFLILSSESPPLLAVVPLTAGLSQFTGSRCRPHPRV